MPPPWWHDYLIRSSTKIGVFCLTLTNVINYYSKFFMDSNDHYINGTSFDEISHIYYFDKEIKGIFFKAILEIEKNLSL